MYNLIPLNSATYCIVNERGEKLIAAISYNEEITVERIFELLNANERHKNKGIVRQNIELTLACLCDNAPYVEEVRARLHKSLKRYS